MSNPIPINNKKRAKFINVSTIISVIEMPPSSSCNYFRNSCFKYPKFKSQFNIGFPAFIKLFYHLDLVFCQFMIWVCLAFYPSFFILPIRSILCVCTKPKMIWFYTFFIVTFVTNAHSFWNRSIMQFIRKPMSRLMFIISKSNLSVTTGQNMAFPVPTVFCLFDFIPKSFYWINRKESSCFFINGRYISHA